MGPKIEAEVGPKIGREKDWARKDRARISRAIRVGVVLSEARLFWGRCGGVLASQEEGAECG